MTWYYKDGDKDVGPIEKTQLQSLYKEKKINANTLVRYGDHAEWRPLKEWVGKKKTTAAAPPQAPPSKTAAAPSNEMPSSPPPGTPLSASPPPQGMDAATGAGPNITVCSQCGRSFPQDQVVRFEGRTVCAACKPLFVQKLREGVDTSTGFRYAGFWIRVAAKLIDGIILMVVQWALLIPLNILLFSSVNMNPSEPDMAAFFGALGLQMVVGLLVPAAYVTFFIGRFSATVGKMACRLKVTAPDGGSISYLRAFGRFWGEMISSLILGIGYLMVAFDDEKRALHDRICATRVIYK
jgi:uncharacterized RDD family membrane protein YckC